MIEADTGDIAVRDSQLGMGRVGSRARAGASGLRRGWRIARAFMLSAAAAAIIAGCASGSGNSSADTFALGTTPKDVTANPAVERIFENSCYSCHSLGGSAPWYAAIVPSYLMSNSAREKLNFSDWNNFDQATKAAAIKQVAAVVADGDMPPLDYRLLHPAAGLSDTDKATIAQWAAGPHAPPALPAH